MKAWSLFLIILLLLLAGCGTSMEKAIIKTEKGDIEIEFFTKEAPITTQNFMDLVNSKFYDGLTFHRVEPGFVIQGGDPKGDGTGGSGKTIPLEIGKGLTHTKGTVAMARASDPNSASSQFYITLEDSPFLDGNYAIFGRVTSGMEVVESIEVGDTILEITMN